jgi:hypothetical protein
MNMLGGTGFKPKNPMLYANQANSTNIFLGDITSVNPEKQTISGVIPMLNGKTFTDIAISNPFTLDGAGIKMMPTPNRSFALLYRDQLTEKEFYHIGYFISNDLSDVTSNSSNTKEGNLFFQRFLDPGEVQIVSISQAEVFLAGDGSIHIKSGSGMFLRLNEYAQAIEGHANDLNVSLDGVRIDAGRVKRVLADDAETNNQPSVMRTITGEGDEEEVITHKEFTVSIGTVYDSETGAPTVDKDPDTDLDTAPTTGTFSFASKVFNQEGEAEKLLAALNTAVNMLVKLPSKMHMGIDETGNFYIVNEQNESYFKFRVNLTQEGTDTTEVSFKSAGMYVTANDTKVSIIDRNQNNQVTFGKDGEGITEFGCRIGNNVITMNDQDGVVLQQSTGSLIEMNAEGDMLFKHKNNRSMLIHQYGLDLSFPDATITLTAKNINLMGSVATGGQAQEGLFAGQATAAFIEAGHDSHSHAGPGATPAQPLNILAGYNGGSLKIAGVQMSG